MASKASDKESSVIRIIAEDLSGLELTGGRVVTIDGVNFFPDFQTCLGNIVLR